MKLYNFMLILLHRTHCQYNSVLQPSYHPRQLFAMKIFSSSIFYLIQSDIYKIFIYTRVLYVCSTLLILIRA
jgi:hypothetical protein